MASIFSKIVAGEIPCFKIAETENCFAFLDVFPLVHGHVLVIPKKEVDYIFDLDDDYLIGLHLFAKKVAKALEATVPCKRIGIAVIGLEVPHAHIHLIPLNTLQDITFTKAVVEVSQEEMASIAAAVAERIVKSDK